MSLDLFGDPIPHLSKTSIGYLASLAELELPDGWLFWALATPEPRTPKPSPADDHECVWLIKGHETRRAWINLTTGQEVTP